MTEQPVQPARTSPEAIEKTEVFFIHSHKIGLGRLSRRKFLYLGLAAGGTALIKGIFPQLGANSAAIQPVQAGMLPRLVAIHPQNRMAAAAGQSCGAAIQNGDFEAGQVAWVEDSAYDIITTDWATPYQGSWVAWLGGYDNADDKLSQLFHAPADVEDSQTLEFYLLVGTQESNTGVYDQLVLRILDASGTPISTDISIADNTTPMGWTHQSVSLPGFQLLADQDVQIEFEATTDSSLNTNFVLDSVSLNLTCTAPNPNLSYTYLPAILKQPTPDPYTFNTPYISDPFDDNTNEWSVGDVDGSYWKGTRLIENGVLDWDGTAYKSFFSVQTPEKAELQGAISNQQVSALVNLLYPAMNGPYGLVLRALDENNFYTFEIGNGQYAFQKRLNGVWQASLVDWTTSPYLSISGWNKMTVQALGGHFRLFFNDHLLNEIDDSALTSGLSGVIVGDWEVGGKLQVQFDNFEVLLP